jgi:hypothetical protein
MKMVPPKVEPRKTLAIDFDGVVHAYSSGWHGGAIYDDPVQGCAEALRELSKRYELVLFTARGNLDDVHLWLVEHHLRHFFKDITNRKPMAFAYLDDRAVRFHDWAGALVELADHNATT